MFITCFHVKPIPIFKVFWAINRTYLSVYFLLIGKKKRGIVLLGSIPEFILKLQTYCQIAKYCEIP